MSCPYDAICSGGQHLVCLACQRDRYAQALCGFAFDVGRVLGDIHWYDIESSINCGYASYVDGPQVMRNLWTEFCQRFEELTKESK
jgi:hypothetical protein